VDPASHALASLALVRGFFPRRSWRFTVIVVLAGTLADLDLLTLLFGPATYLSGRNTLTHSLLGTCAIVAIVCVCGYAWEKRRRAPQKTGPASANGLGVLLLATFLAAELHPLLDLSTPDGIAIFWPFRPTRFAWDLLPATDPWILSLLLAGWLLPLVFSLVSVEIGAKSKSPRGHSGARIALALVCVYFGARFTMHSAAARQLDSHSFRGESPRQSGALPDSLSLLTWHGIAETTSLICTIDVPATPTSNFDSETAACVHKPEPSPALFTAQHTEAVRQFLSASRFPKATVGAMENGTEVVVRDLRYTVLGESRFAPAARVLLDSGGQVTSQRIVWAQDVRLR